MHLTRRQALQAGAASTALVLPKTVAAKEPQILISLISLSPGSARADWNEEDHYDEILTRLRDVPLHDNGKSFRFVPSLCSIRPESELGGPWKGLHKCDARFDSWEELIEGVPTALKGWLDDLPDLRSHRIPLPYLPEWRAKQLRFLKNIWVHYEAIEE